MPRTRVATALSPIARAYLAAVPPIETRNERALQQTLGSMSKSCEALAAACVSVLAFSGQGDLSDVGGSVDPGAVTKSRASSRLLSEQLRNT